MVGHVMVTTLTLFLASETNPPLGLVAHDEVPLFYGYFALMMCTSFLLR